MFVPIWYDSCHIGFLVAHLGYTFPRGATCPLRRANDPTVNLANLRSHPLTFKFGDLFACLPHSKLYKLNLSQETYVWPRKLEDSGLANHP